MPPQYHTLSPARSACGAGWPTCTPVAISPFIAAHNYGAHGKLAGGPVRCAVLRHQHAAAEWHAACQTPIHRPVVQCEALQCKANGTFPSSTPAPALLAAETTVQGTQLAGSTHRYIRLDNTHRHRPIDRCALTRSCIQYLLCTPTRTSQGKYMTASHSNSADVQSSMSHCACTGAKDQLCWCCIAARRRE